jgi:serine/threonine-protein kinase
VFGESGIDARADIWALGALLVRMLGGRAPIEGDTLGEVMKALRRGAVADLDVIAPGLPPEIVALSRAALVVNRNARLHELRRFHSVLTAYANY